MKASATAKKGNNRQQATGGQPVGKKPPGNKTMQPKGKNTGKSGY